MKRYQEKMKVFVAALIAVGFVSPVLAFDSGSTGADGAFNPTVNTALQLPPTGIFNFTSVNIPSGVTVTFTKNATNTPVVILASGNVTIAGAIDVGAATSATAVGAAGDGNLGDDGIPGTGGPGGYAGGVGGKVPSVRGGNGLGPGGGTGGFVDLCYDGGAGGGFGAAGANSVGCTGTPLAGGPAYGSSLLLPLVGGSGGGGATGGASLGGAGGGGGGGAILIASSATLSITGAINANGGFGGSAAGVQVGSSGGGGSGGGIRLVATTISGNGTLNAVAGPAGNTVGASGHSYRDGGSGGVGRIRLEAENITRTAASNPGHTFGAPGPVFVAGFPTLRITSVAGVAVPAQPTGNADVTLPATVANPVTVTFSTTGVPVGNTVKLTLTPANAAPTTAISPALVGTTDAATASVQVSVPSGPSTLQATTTYTIVASLGDLLGNQFAKGERVEKIEVSAGLQGASTVTLVTVSGKRYPMSGPLPAMAVAS
jgi:hypothetical protein